MNTTEQPAKRRGGFPPGVSGNPRGRPKGIVDRRIRILRAIEPELPQLLRTIMDRALSGDMQAAGLVLSRVYPPLRPRSEPVRFAFEPSASIADQCEQLLREMAAGVVAPDVARLVLDGLASLAAARATEELEARVSALENRNVEAFD